MIKKFIIGIDLGGTNLRVALLDSRYRIKDKLVLDTRRLLKKEVLIKAICGCVRGLLDENHLSQKSIAGVGLGLPGPIDVRGGIVHFLPNIPGWKEVGLKNILKKKLKLPVFIDNDANLMTLAEYKLGAARGYNSAVCLTLGTGVGGGIIIGGSIYRGANNATGEIGHIPLNEEGPLCNCGGKACLETYIGNRSIEREARIKFGRMIPLEELSALARKGDRRALTLWQAVALRLGIALAGVVNLLNPDCIVIGGGIANAGNILFAKVRRVVAKRAMPVQGAQVKILKAQLGPDAGLIGAAILVKEGLS